MGTSNSSLIFIFFLSTLLCYAACNTYWRDIEALKQLKLAISPDSVSPGSCISSWDFSFDPCDSLFSDKFTCGFTCEPIGPHNTTRVTELGLDQTGYSGSLGAASWNLPLLRSLDLSGNSFYGPIPDSVSKLTRLHRLTLSRNSVSGSIPDSLGRLTSLEELLLDNNALVGPIPATFSGFVNLKRLEIQGNKLSGEFPDLSRLSSLTFLDCSNNSISGEVPARFPSSLVEISMRDNNLGGNLQEGIEKMQFLQVLDLSHNQLTGSVPASLFTHPSLQQLSLGYNNLSSIEVPGNLGTQSGLIAVDLSDNQLGGLLPGFMGLMPKLSALSLENNSFTGMIPTQYALKTVLPEPGIAPFGRLLLGGNYLFGPIPDPLMRMVTGSANVNLDDNCLFVCPSTLFFCKGGDQKSLVECRNSIGPFIP